MSRPLSITFSMCLLASVAVQGFVTITGGPNADRGVFVSPANDGGFVAVGVTESFGNGGEDVYLVRTDEDGNVVWTSTFGGAGDDNGWVVEELDSGFMIGGFTNSYGAGDFDCFLIKTDVEGGELWSKPFGGEASDRCWSMVSVGDGGFALLGETASFGAGEEDCYLIRTDTSGEELWSKTYGGANGDRCFSIALTRDGGFMIAGQTYSEGDGDRDAYVIRTDASGEVLWTQTFGGPASDVAHFITRTADDEFLITGYTTSLALQEDDPYLIRINDSGDVRWTRVIPLEGVNHTITGEETLEGGFILGGFYELLGERGALLVKTDADGMLKWSKNFLPSRSGQSFGYTVRATDDGGSVLTGHTTEQSTGGLDLFILKTDSNGDS